jgi:hypothetical protein
VRAAYRVIVAGFLGACGGGQQELGLPQAVGQLPAATVVAATGLAPDEEAALMSLADAWGLAGGATLGQPGIAYAQAPGMEVGWRDLGDSPNFRSAWAARPMADEQPGWLFVDLQLAVDRALAAAPDGPVRALVEPLGLGSLEWAMFTFAVPLGTARGFEGRVRVGDDPVSLARAFAGRAGPSLLGAAVEDAVVRIELRCDADVVGRMLDAGTAPDALGAGLAARGALVGLVGQLGRTFVREVDGSASIAVFADQTVCVAVGVREPDDVRDLLDSYFEPAGADVWDGPAGVRFEVVGHALRMATRPWPETTAEAGPVFGPGLHVLGAVDGVMAGLEIGSGLRLEVTPADAATLAVSARALD